MNVLLCTEEDWLRSEEAFLLYASCMYQPEYENFEEQMQSFLYDPSVRVYVCENRGRKTGMMVLKFSDSFAEIIGIAVPEKLRRRGSRRQVIEFNRLCFPSDYWKKQDWHELLCDPRAVYYALVDGDRLIGNVFVYNCQGEDDYVKIMNLSVHPDHRGCGLAHRLLDHVAAEMTRLGMKRFCGETRATNHAMQKVFEGCGYRLNKIEEGYFDQRSHFLVSFRSLKNSFLR